MKWIRSVVLALLMIWFCQTVVQGVWVVTWQWVPMAGQPGGGQWMPIAVEPYSWY